MLCQEKSSAFSSEQQSGPKQFILAVCYPPATLWEIVIGFLSEEIMLRCLLVVKYVHVHRFITTGTGNHLPVHTSQASTVHEASYSVCFFIPIYVVDCITWGSLHMGNIYSI